jgi:hypothetical protein
MSTVNGVFAYQDSRDQLAPHVGKQVEAKGVFRKFDVFTRGVRVRRTALVEQLFVTADGTTLDVGHVWVQYADAIKAVEPHNGEKVEFRATVGTYVKDRPTDDGRGTKKVKTFNLANPEAVVCPDRVPPAAGDDGDEGGQPPPALSAVELILSARQLAAAAGGWGELRKLIDVLTED